MDDAVSTSGPRVGWIGAVQMGAAMAELGCTIADTISERGSR
jgi:hypothetical protein